MSEKIISSTDELPTQEYDDTAMAFEPGVPLEEDHDEEPDDGEGDDAV